MIKGTVLDFAIIVCYFLFILGFGTFFGKYVKSTRDFFFGGQRFSWWLIGFSCVATTVGSYSFIKYSAVAYQYGFSSTMTYLNDWFILPLFVFIWLPIIYYSRITSIPEYFEKRFNSTTRTISVFILLVYLLGYIGINLYTIGVAYNAMF
ncbi:MAG TPA: sodium:solute symporter family protein, partial [Spirochaetota bacterium]|nr:sodium:solute symporter family protein [Spirochaetota bacterium]